MVTYILQSIDDNTAIYKYFPENHINSSYGIISIQLKNGNVSLDLVAEEDFLCKTTANELNKIRDDINRSRIENNELPLNEEELPTATNDEEWYHYANHVINKIKTYIDKGHIPQKGTIAWY